MGRMVGRVCGIWHLRAACAVVALGLSLLAVPAASALPAGAVGGVRSHAAGVLELTVQANENEGVGLRSATVSLGGLELDSAFFGDPACLPDASDPEAGCPSVGTVNLTVTTTAVPDGPHLLRVTIEDAIGRQVNVDNAITVDNAPIVSHPTVTVSVGSGTIVEPPPGGGGGPPQPGGDAGCASPRLSMFLAQNPLRFRRGVPVLAAGRRYRYTGRLTCIVDGRRRPAPRGLLVEFRIQIGKRTVVQKSLIVRKDRRLLLKVAYPSGSRVLVFRVRGAGGTVASVRIPVRVVKVKRGRR